MALITPSTAGNIYFTASVLLDEGDRGEGAKNVISVDLLAISYLLDPL